ncbi:hypothetical protein ACJ41O_010056 [Fusarium nematophilum]
MLPTVPSVRYPNDLTVNYMHVFHQLNPKPETLPNPKTLDGASPGRRGLRPTLSPEEQYVSSLKREKRFHELLSRAGGRPWYPIDLIDDVSKNPQEHTELLQYWKEDSTESKLDDWAVFERQWDRWDQFRRYQLRVRQPPRTLGQHFRRCQKRLAKHSISSPFHLEEHPPDQDELSQWIEYLYFEYAEYKKFSWYKRRHEQYKEAWEKLVDSKMLKPNETRDYIESDQCVTDCDSERTSLRQAVEAARSNVLLAERDLLDPTVKGPTAQRRLFETQEELDSAIRVFDNFKCRKDAIDEFRGATAEYREARRGARRHEILLRWAREQVPLIEKELGLPSSAEDRLNPENDTTTGTDSDWSDEEGDAVSAASPPLPNQPKAPKQDKRKRARIDDVSDQDSPGSGDTPPKRSKHGADDVPGEETR